MKEFNMTTNLDVAKSVVAGMLSGSLATIMQDVSYLSELLETDLDAENADASEAEADEPETDETEESAPRPNGDTIPAPANTEVENDDGLMVTTFYNVTISLAAETASEAYNQLTDMLAVDDVVDYSTDTYNTDSDDEERDSEELFDTNLAVRG
jgi:hypothetical protein